MFFFQQNISLRFCVNTLKSFLPKPEHIDKGFVRFFLPTTDTAKRSCFVYAEISKFTIQALYKSRHDQVIDLADTIRVLRMEMGILPSFQRQQEIMRMYKQPSQRFQSPKLVV